MFSYHVQKSIIIDSKKEDVLALLADFTNWPHWSPWLIIEPTAKLEFSDTQAKVGSSYSWDGELVGSGKMWLRELGDAKIDLDLEFYKPLKSKAKVSFDIKELSTGVEVRWHMDSSVPFYLFFLKKMMKAWIGMDYERGLMLLKEYIEKGKIDARLTLVGESSLEESYFIGIENSASLQDIGKIMSHDFEQLQEYIQNNNIQTSGVPFTYYKEMNIYTTLSSYIAAVPTIKPLKVPAPFISKKLESSRVWKVILDGEYKYLGNAWSLAMMSSRAKGIKIKKRPMGIELYTKEDKTQSEVLLLIK